ncbi:TPM domain-containing protein [Planosporangium sp. 12N6]|uniref:TPM domain-containing protein n=1 Tax=Planosporangium spinosum TaxID=3402278 RepID=UPI003CEB3B91
MRRGLVAAAAATLMVFGTAGPAVAAPAYPAPDGRCVDTTGVLGRQLCDRITEVLRADESRAGDQIAVAVVPTTGDATIETWATGLFNAWGVGQRGRDDGVLLVVAVDDHRLRIATGRGMADRLSDGQANEIIAATITPAFGRGAYAAGILAGLDEIRRRIGHPVPPGTELVGLAGLASAAPPTDATGVAPDDVPGAPSAAVPDSGDADGSPPVWVFLAVSAAVLVVFFVAVARWDRRRGRGAGTGTASAYGPVAGSDGGTPTWFGGGSDGGFGGGGSDGGGSSGSW